MNANDPFSPAISIPRRLDNTRYNAGALRAFFLEKLVITNSKKKKDEDCDVLCE
jgi:hypothetical protein